MKVVIIAGGWHFPRHFYNNALDINIPNGYEVDFVAVCHRNMTKELHVEYVQKVSNLPDDVTGKMDKVLYQDFADIDYLNSIGWEANLYDNTIGDFNFINQWLDTSPKSYDVYIYLSDDVFLTKEWKNFLRDFHFNSLPIFKHNGKDWVPGILPNDWIHIGNCPNPGRKVMRSSTGIFTGDFIQRLGRFNTDNIKLIREGQENNLWKHSDVDEWNLVQRNLQDYLELHKLDNKSFRLSDTYRSSKYMVEAERGLISNNVIIRSSFNKGIQKFINEDNLR